ncbi:uncharacterized protein LOC141595025 [Silene latifolia]|uniref:uncharacterized protein LOC141595025 n=1 Tax=Silene latifolia TaxID=37657 RepID=UPI003D782287
MTNTDTTLTNQPTPPSYSIVHVEQTGQSITPVVFNGQNYDEWSWSFQLALLAKGKLGYIDGSVSKPSSTSDKFEQWQATNALVTMWIFNTLEKSLQRQIALRPEAKLVWEDIRNRFCQINKARIYQLQSELFACRQGPTETLVSYYGRITAIWESIAEQNPLPSCSCNPCACDWATLMTARQNKTGVRDFLMGLDDRFANIRSQILGITPLPSLDLIFNRLLQDEGVINLSSSKSENIPDTLAFAARVHQGNRQPEEGGVVIPFSEWWGDRPRDRIYVDPNATDLSNAVFVPDSRGKATADKGKQSILGPQPKAHMASGSVTDSSRGTPVSSLLRDITLTIQFSHNLCLIQDRSSKTVIGAGEQHEGLYYLKGVRADKKAWHLYDLNTGSYFASRDIIFIETEFPFKNLNIHDLDNISPSSDEALTSIAETLIVYHPPPVNTTTTPPPTTTTSPSSNQPDQLTPDNDDPTSPDPPVLGRGHRTKIPNSNLKDFVLSKPRPSLHSLITKPPPSGTPFPISHYLTYDKFSTKHKAFLTAVTKHHEPSFFKDAIQVPEWRDAMKQELGALEKNQTWTLEPLPPNKKAIGSKWVYKIKYNADGTIERYKARLIVMGNRQIEGVDYNETFTLTIKLVTVRTLLAIAAAKRWVIHQMDVHNAFLHGDLHEEVYMKPPPGFLLSTNGKVCRLRKSLYGLRQAPRCWYAKLASALLKYGFRQCPYDHSLFSIIQPDNEVHVLIYVDDLVICGNNLDFISQFKDYLSKCFHMKDLGVLKYFLGLEVARQENGIFISQRKYALNILKETGLMGSKPSPVPMEPNHRLALSKAELMADPQPYRRLVGRLVYLTITRPELTYSVHILAQFMHAPTSEHWQAAQNVVRYLKNSPGQGILLHSESDLRLNAYCDADYATCPTSRRSLSAYLVFLGSSSISWKTKKQVTVSKSSAESEYRAMAFTVCELKWLKGLLQSLGIQHKQPIQLQCDNKSALHIARNPVFHERTKHIEVDCHFIRDEILKGVIAPTYVHTKAQLVDILTKALGRTSFDELLSKLGVSTLHTPTFGGMLSPASHKPNPIDDTPKEPLEAASIQGKRST